MQKNELQILLQDAIPITKEIQFQIQKLSPGEVTLSVPLSPNRNHKGTAFGGSIFSCCALAAYAQVLNQLSLSGEATRDIVVAESTIKYIAPVNQDFEVHCQWQEADRERFIAELRGRKHARVWLEVQIRAGERICAEFRGRFVART